MKNDVKKERIALLDEVRGLCVVLMVIYHGLFTLGWYNDIEICRQLFRFFMPVEPFFAGVFIFLCGLCCTLSRSNVKRGALLAVVAVGVSVVMAVGFPENAIWFGVLHLLATCILLYALLHRVIARVPGWLGAAICAALLFLCWNLPVQYANGFFGIRGVWEIAVPYRVVQCEWLYPLGLGRIGGTQGDYFPLLPWIFCFFGGSFLGRYVHRLPAALKRSHLPPLAFVGRHALIFYVVHQPIIYGVGTLAAMI
ncbi:MAG: DUF1624 domain-containing protein [Ruminococcaceae bacterium]|nr:DUF1624 domain-containing protein [Oscillospiraceae bacterium]